MLRPIAIALRLLGKVTRPQNNIIVLRAGVTTWSRKTEVQSCVSTVTAIDRVHVKKTEEIIKRTTIDGSERKKERKKKSK